MPWRLLLLLALLHPSLICSAFATFQPSFDGSCLSLPCVCEQLKSWMHCLQVLGAAVHEDEDLRGKAIRLTGNRLLPVPFLAPRIEAFAHEHLRMLAAAAEGEDQLLGAGYHASASISVLSAPFRPGNMEAGRCCNLDRCLSSIQACLSVHMLSIWGSTQTEASVWWSASLVPLFLHTACTCMAQSMACAQLLDEPQFS